MNHISTCPECGFDYVPKEALKKLCPRCLMVEIAADAAPNLADELRTPNQPANFSRPKIADIQPHFDQLEIIELIGHGGMSAVYKARRKSDDRIVALKILLQEVAETDGGVERFSRETNTLAKFSHPNIVKLLDAGQAGAWCFCLMEYVRGQNLRQLMGDSRLPASDVLRLVTDICDGLQYIHDQGVVHRDIKPENILIDEYGRARIADFGLAKLVHSADGQPTVSATNQVVGTPRYIAPEQIDTPKTVDHRADLFSLGVMLYEMLTGDNPSGRFDPPSHVSGDKTSVVFDDVVMRALSGKPEQRYQSARDLRDDILATIAQDQPRSESTDSVKQQRWGGILMAVATAVMLAFGVARANTALEQLRTAQSEIHFDPPLFSRLSIHRASESACWSLLLLAGSFILARVNVASLQSWREASVMQKLTAPVLYLGYLLLVTLFMLAPFLLAIACAFVPVFADIESWSMFGETFGDADRTTLTTRYWMTASGGGFLTSLLWCMLTSVAIYRWPSVAVLLFPPIDARIARILSILLTATSGILLFLVAVGWFWLAR